jgi:hypothetical protein
LPDIPVPQQAQAIVDEEGQMQQTFQIWVEQMTDLDMIVGTGSPEGVVEARQTREYMDDAGTAGLIKYIKKLDDVGGDKSLGWILV